MYTSFYNLAVEPFDSSPDSSFSWKGKRWSQHVDQLKNSILEERGLFLIYGAAGLGKTHFIDELLNRLHNKVEQGYLAISGQNKLRFFNDVLGAFGIDERIVSKVQFTVLFTAFLQTVQKENKIALLVADDAENLRQELLDELRQFSNIENNGAKLLNILLVGRPEMLDHFDQVKNKALKEKIVVCDEIQRLNPKETEQYVKHRMLASGGDPDVFSKGAAAALAEYSQGNISEINRLAHLTLLDGFTHNSRVLKKENVHHIVSQGKVSNRAVDPKDGPADYTTVTNDQTSNPVLEVSEDLAAHDEFRPYTSDRKNRFRFAWGLSGAALICIVGLYLFLDVQNPTGNKDLQQNENLQLVHEEHSVADTVEETGAKGSLLSKKNTVQENNQDLVEEKGKETGVETTIVVAPSDDIIDDVQEKSPITETPQDDNQLVVTKEQTAPVNEMGTDEVVEEHTPIEPVVKLIAEKKKAYPEYPDNQIDEQITGVGISDQSENDSHEHTALVSDLESEAKLSELNTEEVEPIPEILQSTLLLETKPNSSFITDRAESLLQQFINSLRSYPDAEVLVEGFIASKNNSEENILLSEKRASIVADILIENGIRKERITIRGMGNQKPLATNNTSAGRRKNRRVEVSVRQLQ